MTHDSFRELIQREIDGDLTSQELVLLKSHIASCDDCRREWEDYKRLADLFGNLPKAMPEKSFVTLMEPDLPQVLEKKRRLPRFFWPGITAAAALVLAVSLSDVWGLFSPSRPENIEVEQSPVVQQPAPEERQAITAEGNRPETKLITQETVKEKPAVQVVAVSKNELDKVRDQTGVKVEATKVGDATLSSAQNGVVVVTVDSRPTDVKVDGDNVTVVVAPDRQVEKRDGSDVRIYGIAGLGDQGGGEKTVTFTDEQGNVIERAKVNLTPISGPLDLNISRAITNAHKADPSSQTWAKDPYQVVVHSLKELGFAPTAIVSQSNELSVVTVTQDDHKYQILLKESSDGFWQPTQISRVIQPHNAELIERKAIAYLADQKAKGAIHNFGEVYLMERKDDLLKIMVRVERKDQSGAILVERSSYEFQVIRSSTGDVRLGDQVKVKALP